jgi:hypothetical protein
MLMRAALDKWFDFVNTQCVAAKSTGVQTNHDYCALAKVSVDTRNSCINYGDWVEL